MSFVRILNGIILSFANVLVSILAQMTIESMFGEDVGNVSMILVFFERHMALRYGVIMYRTIFLGCNI